VIDIVIFFDGERVADELWQKHTKRNAVQGHLEHLLFKGIIHPKMKILLLINHPYVVPNP